MWSGGVYVSDSFCVHFREFVLTGFFCYVRCLNAHRYQKVRASKVVNLLSVA